MAKRKRKRKRAAAALTAKNADRYDLYLRSVQEPEAEVEFFDRIFRKQYKRRPAVLREDFCAAAAICCEWARSRKDRRAIGVDLDPEPVEWGRKYNLSKLKPEARDRVNFLLDDVRHVSDDKADMIAAENFSYFIFKTRDELRQYFEAAYHNLADEGLFVLDIMGGPEVIADEQEDVRKIRIKKGQTPGIAPSKGVELNGLPTYDKCRFTYVWDQAKFDPISHHGLFYIHFRFDDGSKLKRAFEYDWRLWTIPEVREVLADVGFSSTDVYWEGTDEDGEGNGIYTKREHAPCEQAWIAYVVGVK